MSYNYEELRTGITELAEKNKYIFITYFSLLKGYEEW